jgi:hypothetical protein
VKVPLTVFNPVERSCGDCQECCTTLAVNEIDKPEETPCVHLCLTGCSIYERRPGSCRSYQCAWQEGVIEGDERRRPDKLGVIFDAGIDPIHRALVAREIRPGAFEEPPARYVLDKLSQGMLIYMMWHRSNRRRLIGPAGLVQRAMEQAGGQFSVEEK